MVVVTPWNRDAHIRNLQSNLCRHACIDACLGMCCQFSTSCCTYFERVESGYQIAKDLHESMCLRLFTRGHRPAVDICEIAPSHISLLKKKGVVSFCVRCVGEFDTGGVDFTYSEFKADLVVHCGMRTVSRWFFDTADRWNFFLVLLLEVRTGWTYSSDSRGYLVFLLTILPIHQERKPFCYG